jgi:putative oxidoreductase
MSEERGLAAAWQPRVLSIFRFLVGLLYMQHGLNKLFDFPPTAAHQPYVLFSLNPGLAGLLEVFGGALVALGLFTRCAAFILSGEMAVAYFMVFWPRSFFPMASGGNLAALYCWVFFYLFVAGGGPWSLDRLLRGRG